MASPDDMRREFEAMGLRKVSRSIGCGLFNMHWEREAAMWLAERETALDALRDGEVQRTMRLAKSASIAGWVGVGLAVLSLMVAVVALII